MVMSWLWTAIIAVALLSAMLTGNGTALAASILTGAKSGINLAISMAGSVCLWCGVGKLMENNGMSAYLARLLQPILHHLFPSTRSDKALAADLSANICANILGLGNAATPMGIKAATRLAKTDHASDEMCRLIVLNTASIQLIPATVAAIRSGLGAVSAFDILPAVWITSICSASLGLSAAWVFGKLWKHD